MDQQNGYITLFYRTWASILTTMLFILSGDCLQSSTWFCQPIRFRFNLFFFLLNVSTLIAGTSLKWQQMVLSTSNAVPYFLSSVCKKNRRGMLRFSQNITNREKISSRDISDSEEKCTHLNAYSYPFKSYILGLASPYWSPLVGPQSSIAQVMLELAGKLTSQ